MLKYNLNLVFRLFLGFQFLWCQVAFANNENIYTTADRMTLMTAMPNLMSALDVVSLYTGKEDVKAVISKLKKHGISLSEKMPLTMKDGNLYYNAEKFGISNSGLTYKGIVLKYNYSKSFEQNYESFLSKLEKNGNYSIQSLFINNANASEKSQQADSIAGLALIATVGAFLFEAPMWVVGVGIASIVLFGGLSVAYADELDSGVTGVRDFNCLPNGWSVKNKEGTVINTTKDKAGSIQVETINKAGAKSVKPATDTQIALFKANEKLCEAGNSQVVKEIKEKIKAGDFKTDVPHKGANESHDGAK